MELAASLSPKVELEFDRRKWRLVFTHRVLLECEECTGAAVLTGVDLSSARLVRALLYFALKRADAPYTLRQVGDRIRPSTLAAIHEAISSAWLAAMPEPEPEGEAASGRKAKSFTWLEAWATARYDLGLSDEEWLDMTPRQLHALKKRQLERWQREELLVGIIASTSANFSMCHPKKPFRADSFMLHPLEKEEEPQQTPEDVMRVFGMIAKRQAQIARQ